MSMKNPGEDVITALEIKLRDVIYVNDVRVEVLRIVTTIGDGVAETVIAGREWTSGRPVTLAVPPDWKFRRSHIEEDF